LDGRPVGRSHHRGWPIHFCPELGYFGAFVIAILVSRRHLLLLFCDP
jgi:hypothetical protein